MGDPSNSDQANSSPYHVKACEKALQTAQKRVRLAFFLTMGASCIVLLIVLNLRNSLLVHNALLHASVPDKFDYLKEYSKQVADQSFYQIPALGIQITCDDIGLLGPLTLLVFSLYSFITLKACRCHVRCAASHRGDNGNTVIDALLEVEQPFAGSSGFVTRVVSGLVFFLGQLLQFLPLGACIVVIFYWKYAHFW